LSDSNVNETSLEAADDVSASVVWRLAREARDSEAEDAATPPGISVLLLLLLSATMTRLRVSAVVEDDRVGVWVVKEVGPDAVLSEEEEVSGLVPEDSLQSDDFLLFGAVVKLGKLFEAVVSPEGSSPTATENPAERAVSTGELLETAGLGELLETAGTVEMLEVAGIGEMLGTAVMGKLPEIAAGKLLETACKEVELETSEADELLKIPEKLLGTAGSEELLETAAWTLSMAGTLELLITAGTGEPLEATCVGELFETEGTGELLGGAGSAALLLTARAALVPAGEELKLGDDLSEGDDLSDGLPLSRETLR
jgi:hypothetical protein